MRAKYAQNRTKSAQGGKWDGFFAIIKSVPFREGTVFLGGEGSGVECPSMRGCLQQPRAGCNVWPEQTCPAFRLRGVGLCGRQCCWFCRYANFHLLEQNALEVGVCCWPRDVLASTPGGRPVPRQLDDRAR